MRWCAARRTSGRTSSRHCCATWRQAGFGGAPRALGYDELGREVLTFVEGDVPSGPPYELSDVCLLSATGLIRAFHDAAASSPLRDGQEVVCHGDLGPHNTVFRGENAVAIIDGDAISRPGGARLTSPTRCGGSPT